MNYIDDGNPFTEYVAPDLMRMNAIWLANPVTQGDGTRSVRITPNTDLRIVDGEIVDCEHDDNGDYILAPTHRVIDCYGTSDSTDLEIYIHELDKDGGEIIGKITTLKL
jgi:hypothetical protein